MPNELEYFCLRILLTSFGVHHHSDMFVCGRLSSRY